MEHRLTERLIGYWENLRKADKMPDFTHFNISAIDDIWQQCILFTVQPSAEGKANSLVFSQVGEKVRALYSDDMVGRSFTTSQRHFQAAAIVRKLENVITNPSTLIDIGQFINEQGKIVKYRSCLLPFGRDGKVTHVVVALTWRQY